MTEKTKVAGATRVMDLMTTNPITINPDVTVERVMALMQEASIRHVPVVDDQGLLGMISERDLRFIHRLPGFYDSLGGEEVQRMLDAPVGVIMKSRFLVERDVTILEPEEGLKRAIDLIISTSVGALPVVDPDGEVVGILSATDILRRLSDDLLD
jgi:acetoin utilization protein AcuB